VGGKTNGGEKILGGRVKLALFFLSEREVKKFGGLNIFFVYKIYNVSFK